MKKRLVILGIDHGHYKAIIDAARADSEVELTALAQETPPFAEAIAENYNVKCYRSYLECLDNEKPDVVGIAMFNGARGKWIVEALERGIPVITDKPMCVTLKELDEIEKAHQLTDVPVCMMLTCRCQPEFITIKDAVTKGLIGRIISIEGTRYYALNRPKRPDWMFESDKYGGPALDILMHDYDLARWITGYKWGNIVVDEMRSGLINDLDFKDMARLAGTEEGSFLNLNMSWHSPVGHKQKFTIYGTEGYIDLPLGGKTPVIVRKQGEELLLPLDCVKPFASQFFESLENNRIPLPLSTEEGISVVRNILNAKK